MMVLAALGLLLQAGQWQDMGSDARLYATAPARWDAGDWGMFAAAAGGSLALAAFADRPVRTWMLGHRDSTVSGAAEIVRQAGNGLWTVPMAAALWGGGAAFGAPREERVGREAIEALAFSGAVSQGLKYATGRRRPTDGNDDPWSWGDSHGNADGLSFPSGHAQASWSVLTVVALEYRHVPGAEPLAFGLAGACALSRLYDNRHWASDVVAGSLLGLASGWAIVKWNHGRDVQAAVPPGLSFRLAF
jgi:membrane-associated phospholipid phosphatase